MPINLEITQIYIQNDGSFSMYLEGIAGNIDLSSLEFDEELKTFTVNGEKVNLTFAENLTAIDSRGVESLPEDGKPNYKEIEIDQSANDLSDVFDQLDITDPKMNKVHLNLEMFKGSTLIAPDERMNPEAHNFYISPNFLEGVGTIVLNKGAEIWSTNASEIVISPDDAEESVGVGIFKNTSINGTVLYLGNWTNVTIVPFNPEAQIKIEGTDVSLRIGDLPDKNQIIDELIKVDSEGKLVDRRRTNPVQQELADLLGVEEEAPSQVYLPYSEIHKVGKPR